MPTDTPAADVIAREFGYFLRQESAIGRPEDFADHLTRELADAGYTIAPTPTSDPEGQPCTGVTARWCPTHGTCQCGPEDQMSMPGCPLHDPLSPHASADPKE